MKILILQGSPRANGNQIQTPIQRMYCVNKPANVKKMALLMSSYSPKLTSRRQRELSRK